MTIEIMQIKDSSGSPYFSVVVTQQDWSDTAHVLHFDYSDFLEATYLIRQLLKSNRYDQRISSKES